MIAALPGFLVIADGLKAIPGVLVNEAVTVTALAGITGSASGGMSIALATMADSFVAAAHSAGIPLEVLHRIAAMASGGMDTLPHNGAVITLLAVTGLTHKDAYRDIFAITLHQDRRRGGGHRRVLRNRDSIEKWVPGGGWTLSRPAVASHLGERGEHRCDTVPRGRRSHAEHAGSNPASGTSSPSPLCRWRTLAAGSR